MRRSPVLLGAAAALAVTVALAGPAGAQEDEGAVLYRDRCSGCHGAAGAGSAAFPPLAGNPNVDDAGYVRGVIADGRSGQIVVNGTTYDGVMPDNLDDGLDAAQIDAIVAFVQGDLQTPAASATTTTAAPEAITPIAEDAVEGQRLFLGQESFREGGPACAACHAAGEHGDLVGVDAGFGSDLTGAWESLGGADGMVEALRDPHPGAMAAPYADRPLTAEEIGALASYLEVAGDRRSGAVFDGLVLIALAGFGILVATTAMVVAGRRESEKGAA